MAISQRQKFFSTRENKQAEKFCLSPYNDYLCHEVTAKDPARPNSENDKYTKPISFLGTMTVATTATYNSLNIHIL